MIVEGEVVVTKQSKELATRGVSDYFGELSLKTVRTNRIKLETLPLCNSSDPYGRVRKQWRQFQQPGASLSSWFVWTAG